MVKLCQKQYYILQLAEHCSTSSLEYCKNHLGKCYMTVFKRENGTMIPTKQLLMKLTYVKLVNTVSMKLGGLLGFNLILL